MMKAGWWIYWLFAINFAIVAFLLSSSLNVKYHELEPTSKFFNVVADHLLPPMTALYQIKANDYILKASIGFQDWLEQLCASNVVPVSSEKVCIKQIDNDCAISAIIYKPQSERKVRPIVVWYHGGGWILGSPENDHSVCQKLALRLDSIVVNVDYRLAPRYPFPTAAEDSYFALDWVRSHAHNHGGDPSKLIVAGESAGGNLAAVMAAMDISSGIDVQVGIKALLLVYPVLDWTSTCRPLLSNNTGVLSMQTIEFMRRAYTSNKSHELQNDLRYAPLHAFDSILSQFPPTVIVLAKHDVLAPEGLAFADKLQSLRVPVNTLMYNHSIHCFYGRWLFAEGERALNDSTLAVRAFMTEK